MLTLFTRNLPRLVVVAALCSCVWGATPVAAEEKLVVAPGSVWVMSGDSITAQRQHSNYIEAFYRTRFPQAKLQFRNSGIGGNRTQSIIARFDYDLAAFKPSIISIELGMNDVGAGDDPKAYIDGMKKLIDLARGVKATPVLISSSPVNDGSKLDDWKSDRCRRIHPYTLALAELAQKEKVVMVDQYHELLDLWAKNKVDGKDVIPLTGDPVHPGPVGQLTMAAVILERLGVDREVSAVRLQADGTVSEAKRCQITNVSKANGGLTFTRTDERGVWPIPTAARPALKLLPKIADLSQYSLQVTGLPKGNYTVAMDKTVVATLTSDALNAGVNLSAVEKGPLADRAAKILALIGTLQGVQNNNWRAASKAKDDAKLKEAQAAIDATEAELATACQPAPIVFEIRPSE